MAGTCKDGVTGGVPQGKQTNQPTRDLGVLGPANIHGRRRAGVVRLKLAMALWARRRSLTCHFVVDPIRHPDPDGYPWAGAEVL